MQVLWMVLVTLDWRCAGPGARGGGTRCREDQAELTPSRQPHGAAPWRWCQAERVPLLVPLRTCLLNFA